MTHSFPDVNAAPDGAGRRLKALQEGTLSHHYELGIRVPPEDRLKLLKDCHRILLRHEPANVQNDLVGLRYSHALSGFDFRSRNKHVKVYSRRNELELRPLSRVLQCKVAQRVRRYAEDHISSGDSKSLKGVVASVSNPSSACPNMESVDSMCGDNAGAPWPMQEEWDKIIGSLRVDDSLNFVSPEKETEGCREFERVSDTPPHGQELHSILTAGRLT